MVDEIVEVPDPEVTPDEAPEVEEQETEQPEGDVKEEAKPEGEEKPEKPPKGFVPQGALHEERARRKELQQKIAALSQAQEHQRQVLEHRFAQMQQALAQQNAPKPPAFEEDPVGAMRFEQEQQRQALAQLTEAQRAAWHRQQEESQRQQYFGQLQSAVSQAEREFAEEAPDYLDAVKHLKSQRAAQLEALGMPPNEIVAYVNNEAAQIAEAALRSGRNPAETAYKMAVAAGYKKAAPNQGGQQKIETLQKGAKAAQSLGSGGVPKGQLSIQALAEMDDADFDAAIKSGAWEKLGLGG